ncbi:MAG TPA: hypothetical protein VF612_10415 [Jatrophihabitans sp.]|uniref:hypothetical protein n=1 Tax=Jatrophihabitans sp. TaxID=1932789 RepID=UPI002F1B7BA6
MSTSTAAVLAASDTGKGSPIGLFVVLLLLIATYLLYRSMSGHLRRLPERFPGYQAGVDEAADPDGAASPDGAAGPGGPVGPNGERAGSGGPVSPPGPAPGPGRP